jgi:hypothetical protein
MVQRRLVGKRLKPEGWACACVLLFLFWPLTCVPCCLDDCKGVLWAHTSTYCHLTAFPPHYDCFRQTEEVRVSAWDLSSSRADYLPRVPSLQIWEDVYVTPQALTADSQVMYSTPQMVVVHSPQPQQQVAPMH